MQKATTPYYAENTLGYIVRELMEGDPDVRNSVIGFFCLPLLGVFGIVAGCRWIARNLRR